MPNDLGETEGLNRSAECIAELGSKIEELGHKLIISDRDAIRIIIKEKEERESQLDK